MTRPIKIDGFLDIECAVWDRMIVGVLYTPADGAIVVRTPDELVDELTIRGGTWWCWNGGRYDSLQIAEVLRQRGRPALCHPSGSSISRIVSGNLSIVDACALIPMPLGKKRGFGNDDQPCGAELADLEPPGELGWPCICGTRGGCGGYCRIRTGMHPTRLRQLTEYCANDARVGYQVVTYVLAHLAGKEITVKSTLGGTAWATAKAWANLPDAEWRSQHWRQVRRAYYGGRVTVFRPSATIGAHYDLSSAYPAALAATPLPIGDPVEVGGRRAQLAYTRGMPGCYVAEVEVPADSFVPPLPMRIPTTNGVCYPVGRFVGEWTLPELQSAEARGTKIRKIREGIVWPDGASPLFADVVTRWYGYRMSAGKGSAWGAYWRLMANSLTGKFAEQPDRQSIALNPGKVRICVPGSKHAKRGRCTLEWCTGRCGAYKQLDTDGRVFGVPYYRIGASSHVHWAAYLTAATRITLLGELEHIAAAGDAVYSDTDSIWTTGTAPYDVGSGIGQWELKHGWSNMQIRAAKVYRYFDTSTGEVVCRAAGMPHLSDEQWRQAEQRDREIVSDRGVMTLLEAAPGGKLFRRRYRHGKLPEPTGWYGDRTLRRGSVVTYPATYGENKAREARRARVRDVGS